VWPLIMMCISAASCASGPEKPPLPIWQNSYASDFGSIPPGRTAFLSPDYSKLILVIKDDAGRKSIKIASFNKSVVPVVNVAVARDENSHYEYTYKLINRPDARDSILRFWIVVPAAFDSPSILINGAVGPNEWSGGIGYAAIGRQCELGGSKPGRFATWVGTSRMTYSIAPGRNRGGLGLKTLFGPGFTTAYVGGDFVFVPEEYEGDLQITSDPVWTMVHLPVIGPMFDQKASCGEILKNYHQGLTRLLQCVPPERDKGPLSALLAEIDNTGSSSCGQLLSKLQAQPRSETQMSSDIVNALRLTLENK